MHHNHVLLSNKFDSISSFLGTTAADISQDTSLNSSQGTIKASPLEPSAKRNKDAVTQALLARLNKVHCKPTSKTVKNACVIEKQGA
jgi:hypothetical protein